MRRSTALALSSREQSTFAERAEVRFPVSPDFEAAFRRKLCPQSFYSVTTFNNLIDLEAAYGDYSKRFLTALGEAGRLGEEGIQLSKKLLREHDRSVQIHTNKISTMRELPESVTKWL